VFDGDFGNYTGFGYRHQTFDAGIKDLLQSANFVLPKGAACGFHHTKNSPGETCMGFHPEQAFMLLAPIVKGCPEGWTPRQAGDANSGGGFWAWCEYDDPHHLSIGGPIAQAVGVACGISHNGSGEDPGPVCMGYRPVEAASVPYPLPPVLCPVPGMFGLGWLDLGRPGGIGLGFCTTTSDVIPPPAPSRGFLDTIFSSDGTFNGWAYDPSAPETPIYVDIYIDGPAGSGAAMFRIVADGSRPDVNTHFGISGSHGYSFTLPAQYRGARHTVYAYGISLYGQANPLLAQSPGTYSPPAPPPPPPPLCRGCYTP
jgi:hypothetical protein